MVKASGFLKGTAIISSINMLRLVIQFLTLPILARLLSPEDYGLIGMAMPIVLLVMVLADSGLGNSLVRDHDASPLAWHSCFWLTVVLGAVLALSMVLVSPLIGWWLHQPALTGVISALATVVFLQSITLIPGAVLQQRQLFGRIALCEMIALVGSVGCTLWAAMSSAGVWALVVQQVSLYAIRVVLTSFVSPYRPRLLFSRQEAKSHVVFGWNLLASNLILFGGRTAESSVIGKFRGVVDLGIYGMAFQFARLPFMLVTGPLQYVVFPLVSASRHDPGKLRRQVMILSKVIALVMLTPMAVAAAVSHMIFESFLSTKWIDSGYIFTLIAPAAAVQTLTGILGTFVQATGQPEVQLRMTVQATLLWMLALAASVRYDISTVAIAYTVSTLVASLRNVYVILPLLNCSYRDYALAIGKYVLLAIICFVLVDYAVPMMPKGDLGGLVFAGLITIFVTAVLALMDGRSLLRDYRASY